MLKVIRGIGRKASRDEDVRIRVKSDRGLSVMRISGTVTPVNIDVLRRAMDHFEKSGKIKYYIDLSKTTFLCEEAIEIITTSLATITSRGDIFDIIDMCLEAEMSLKAANFDCRPSYMNSCAYSACM